MHVESISTSSLLLSPPTHPPIFSLPSFLLFNHLPSPSTSRSLLFPQLNPFPRPSSTSTPIMRGPRYPVQIFSSTTVCTGAARIREDRRMNYNGRRARVNQFIRDHQTGDSFPFPLFCSCCMGRILWANMEDGEYLL